VGAVDDDDDAVTPLGIVPLDGRGSLPYALVNGESLVACASWALGEAEVDLVDFNVPWQQVRDSGRPLVLHDPLCPLTPPAFISAAIALSRAEDVVVVGVLPDGAGEQVVSPVVVPGRVLATIADEADLVDFPALVDSLQRDGAAPVRRLEAPTSARRVSDEADLEALTRVSAPAGDLPVEGPVADDPR
jgi:2-C-methyl-D-erythritol 4-phosphate cytidylyltransferase